MSVSNAAFDYEVETEEEQSIYTDWLRERVKEGLEDTNPLISHDEVMGRMFAQVERLKAKNRTA